MRAPGFVALSAGWAVDSMQCEAGHGREGALGRPCAQCSHGQRGNYLRWQAQVISQLWGQFVTHTHSE